MIEAFDMINKVLIQSVKSISSIISRSGHINVDFADLRTIMKGKGLAMMGTGSATGANRAVEAAKKAIASELLENVNIKSARGVLLNVSAGSSLSLHEINAAAKVIYDESDKDAEIIVGSVVDTSMGDELVVSVVATGFPQAQAEIPLMTEKLVKTVPVKDEKKLNTESQLAKVISENTEVVSDNLEVPAYLRQQDAANNKETE